MAKDKKMKKKKHKKVIMHVKQDKISKVMDEFKAGKLHSGSKHGPEVTKRSQAIAIALSEGRKAAKLKKK